MTPRLLTERLVLDAPREEDADAVLAICRDPEILRWVPLPSPFTREDAEFFVRSYGLHGETSGRYTVWAVRLRGTPTLLGAVELRRDDAARSGSFGCWLAPGSRGHGYMREAVAAVCRYAFSPAGPGFEQLRWECLAGNDRSRRLAEAVGFAFDDRPRSVEFRGEQRPAVIGTLTRALPAV
ncbi:GNAT family N-acetyltransferase [Leifsonia sp. AG29]|uniref:GNAT family N-acetyltransferase n=1 Tax=Leifsonia sp. AG29 TaxID=2598860 RepID=UPI00131DB859|nr:GNAT family N-acetyltransferase [Leifsonia sp. AG29]